MRPHPLSHLAPQLLHSSAQEWFADWYREKRKAPLAFRKCSQVMAKGSPLAPTRLVAPHAHWDHLRPPPLALEIVTVIPTPWLRNGEQDSTLSLQFFQTNFSEIFI